MAVTRVPQLPRGATEDLDRSMVGFLNSLAKAVEDRKSQNVADIASPTATDLASVVLLANELKLAVNELLAKLRNVDLMES